MGDDKGVGVFVFTIAMALLIPMMLVGYKASSGETARIYNKCLVELQDKPYKQAVEICKDRIK